MEGFRVVQQSSLSTRALPFYLLRAEEIDMTVIVFRSRLVPDLPESYGPRSAEMFGYAQKMPGFRSIKLFTADDGERVSLIEFETEAQSRAWREHVENRKAQREGRDLYYANTASRYAR